MSGKDRSGTAGRSATCAAAVRHDALRSISWKIANYENQDVSRQRSVVFNVSNVAPDSSLYHRLHNFLITHFGHRQPWLIGGFLNFGEYYEILTFGIFSAHFSLTFLNQHGAEGWELVSVSPKGVAIFKRPKK